MAALITAPRIAIRRAAVIGGIAAVGSSVAAIVVATVAEALGVQRATQLEPSALAALTIIGVGIGTVAWVLIARRAADPSRVLRRVVPSVLVVSFVPDLAVGLGSDSWGAALTLAFAHVCVFGVTLTLLSTQLTPARLRTSAGRPGQHGNASGQPVPRSAPSSQGR